MQQPNLTATQRNLGELAGLAHQTEQTERNILKRAKELHAKAQRDQAEARKAARAGDAEASKRYLAATEDIGRLERVINKANRTLST